MTRGRKAAALVAVAAAAAGVALAPAAEAVSIADIARRALNADRVDGFSAGRVARPNQLVAVNRKGVLPATASNALAVGGIEASRTAKAGQLLALDRNGRFPASVLSSAPASLRTYTGTVGMSGRADGPPDAADDALSSWLGADISLPVTLEVPLDETMVGILGGGVELPDCEGTFEAPTAPAGTLCIYPGRQVDLAEDVLPEDAEIVNVATNGEGSLEAYSMPIGDGTRGIRVEVKAAAAGLTRFYATWAYTAP